MTALAREAERTGRRVGALEALVRELAGQIAALVPAPSGVDGEGGAGSAVRSWLLADDPAEAASDLADLAGWLGAVYLRYPGAALPSCWPWHPAVVEELRWLREAHRAAYDPEAGSWREVGDWHDRQRPGVAKRIGAAVGSCELALHTPGGEQARPAAVAPLAHATAQLATTWTHERTSPDPTPEQLDDAARHDREQTRTPRR